MAMEEQKEVELLREHPSYSIDAIAHEAGYASVRTLNRKIQNALGVTPGEFRVMNNPDD